MRCLICPNIGRLMHQKFSFLVDLVVPVEANLIFLENNLIDLSFSILFRASSQTKSSKMLVETEDGKILDLGVAAVHIRFHLPPLLLMKLKHMLFI